MNIPIPFRTSLRTLSLSATGPRTIHSILSTTAHPGKGCYKRIYLFDKMHPENIDPSKAIRRFIKLFTIPDV
jgi:hypothetical protein